MSEQKNDDQKNTTGFATKPFIDANYMREKRNVDPIRQRLYEYITGLRLQEVAEKDSQGDVYWVRKYVPVTRPKLNNEGVGYLLSAFDLVINNQTVMGNITRAELWQYLGNYREDLACNLWENSDYYGLHMRHYHEIVGEFMSCVELFLTRPIDNKERESDTQSTKYVETNQPASTGRSRGVKGLLGL